MKSKLLFRRNAKHLSLRKWYLSLSSIEQVRLKRLKQFILVLFCKIYHTEDKSELEDLNDMLEAAIMKYLFVKIGDKDDLEKCERYDRTIESFSPSDCKIFFEFKKGDLMRLFRLFNFPDVCQFDNKSVNLHLT